MLTLWGSHSDTYCDRIGRRQFLTAGALGIGGLTLAELCRLRAEAPARRSAKSVIMLWLGGGPSHLDMYDLKPDAPAEIRGEFKPSATCVPGFDICEHMPRQARLADKLALVRSLWFDSGAHDRSQNFSGYRDQEKRPAFGSLVSRFRCGADDLLPHYVSMVPPNGEQPYLEHPTYAGAAHKPFRIEREGKVRDLAVPRGLTLEQLADRKQLVGAFDNLRRHLDTSPDVAALDAFSRQALDMVTSPKALVAFDLSREPARVRDRYGKPMTARLGANNPTWDPARALLARRLVEAGVSVVTLPLLTSWDHHGGPQSCGNIFTAIRWHMECLDHTLHALITDLDERGLTEEVAVVVWGEMGRTPRINKGPGRDHWGDAGFVLFAGGGLKMGQVIGETTPRGEKPKSRPISTRNVLSTLYHVLGIDPVWAIPDFTGRPMHLLDDREPIRELL